MDYAILKKQCFERKYFYIIIKWIIRDKIHEKNRGDNMILRDRIKEKVLLTDGAMGTYYNQKYSSEIEAEEANLISPEQVVAIHKEYIDAGASIIRTNTFAVNHLLFPEKEVCRNAIVSAVSSARKAVEESGKDVLIVASIGPIKQSAAEADEQILDEYQFLIDTFVEEGIQSFVFETFSELKWIQPLSEYCKEKCIYNCVIAQFSVNPMGYTQDGYGISGIIQKMSELETVDVFGFNCGVGALHLRKLLEQQTFPGDCILSALPNAGYQQELRGRMRYKDEPGYYAKQMKGIIELGANIIGGCCGTTPEHIAALEKLLGNQNRKPETKKIIPVGEGDGGMPYLRPTAFVEKLNRGEKVFVVELDAPFDADTEKFSKGIYALKENDVDIITVSDSPLARSRADASLMSVYAKSLADISIMPHIAMRDRNLIGLRSEVLAYVNGIRDFLVITGDPVGKENRGRITGVFDTNSIRFMEYLKHMNEEVFGEYPVYYGGALNYNGVNKNAIADRMRKKKDAGCSYFLTQPVFSQEDIQRIRELKKMADVKIICGLMPLVSYRNAMFMQHEMPGIHVDERIISRYTPDMSREEAEETAVSLCADIARDLYDAADGFYLMTPFHRVGLVNRVIDSIRQLG